MMYWDSIEAFLKMGRHGAYVWSCLLLVMLCVACELVALGRARRQVMKRLQRLATMGQRADDSNTQGLATLTDTHPVQSRGATASPNQAAPASVNASAGGGA